MLTPSRILRHALLAALAAANLSWAASNVRSVDASSPPPIPHVGPLQMGSAAAGHAPNGDTLSVTSESILFNGKPWVPVMGEFHYTRYPDDQWLQELLKMKAAGVDIVSTYVIWIHHEEVENKYVFSGNRNITKFIETASEVGLSVVVRLGPWVHAEVRNGGIPDFVVNRSSLVRSNDPVYISFVTSFWKEVAERIKSFIFKSGGKIIAVQLENEYSLNGPGQGAAHIAKLKALAISLGFDMPLYTCTGWQSTLYPPYQVVPVFGGYQDAPWDTTVVDEAPSETYSFRFFSRESGAFGYPPNNPNPNSQSELAAYPYLTAEYGGGAGVMYRRRVVLSLPDDVAATIPVQLGSGVNMYGYYMFQGGINPRGVTETLQESTATGSWNDLPIFEYDYQAPLGQYGQQRSSLNRIKQYHYWLNRFGNQLAGMSMRQPAVIPYNSTDLSSLRWSVRSNGKSGYLFQNNYVRQHAMAAHTDIQFAVKFSSGTVTFPTSPITIPSGAYFVWPLNLSLGSANLVYATAQLMTSVNALGQTVYIFVATDGVPVEFAFDADTVAHVGAIAGTVTKDTAGRTLVKSVKPGLDPALHFTDKDGKNINIIVVDQTTADSIWQLTVGGQDTLIFTEQALGPTSSGFELTNVGSPDFSFATFPAIDFSATNGAALSSPKANPAGLFTTFKGSKKSRKIPVATKSVKAPGIAPPILVGGQAGGALQPNETAIEAAQGQWAIEIPWSQVAEVDDAWLTIKYEGDLARLYTGSVLLDDNFYDGTAWVISLKRFASTAARTGNLTLAIMPLRSDAPIYLQSKPKYNSNGQACSITSITIDTVYSLDVKVK